MHSKRREPSESYSIHGTRDRGRLRRPRQTSSISASRVSGGARLLASNACGSVVTFIVETPLCGSLPGSLSDVPGIVLSVPILQAEWAYRRYLGNILAGLRPMVMKGIAGQNDDASRR